MPHTEKEIDELLERPQGERPIRYQAARKPRDVRFSQLYTGPRTRDGLGIFCDFSALASQSVTNATTGNFIVTPNVMSNLRLSRWPGGVSAYLMVNHFSIAPVTTVAAITGAVQCSYEDPNGHIIPLGDFIASVGGTKNIAQCSPAPITDPGLPNFGLIHINYQGGTAAVTFSYSLGFSIVYALPSEVPYDNAPPE